MLRVNYCRNYRVAVYKIMNKLGKISIKRAFAGVSALTMFAIALMGVAATFVAMRPVPVKAQAAGTFEWINAATIKVGDLIFTDSNPFDNSKWFNAAGSGLCSYSGSNISNIATDRILIDSGNAAKGTRFVIDPKIVDNAGVSTCTAKSSPVTAANTNNADILWYRVGDTVRPVINSGVAFERTATANIGNSTGVEVFTRVGERTTPCHDIITHGTNGDWNGWVIYPMAPEGTEYAEEDPSTVRSERYEQVFPGDTGCARASKEIAEVFKAGRAIPPGCSSPDDTVCGGQTVGYPADQYKEIWGDDAFLIVGGVGTEVNASDPNAQLPPEEVKKTACDQSFAFVDIISLKWIVCPIINMIMSMVDFLEAFLTDLLKINMEPLADDGPLHTVWASMRSIALAIIVIVALVIVIFEAVGVEASSAYTRRTVLTRFAVAVVFIVFSWRLGIEVINVVNNFVDGARDLIYAPFNAQLGTEKLATGSSAILLLLGTGAVLALGPWGLLTFLVTIGISIAVTVIVLILAQAILYMVMMLLPIFIALRILENTKSAGDFGIKTGTVILFATVTSAAAMPAMNAIADTLLAIGGTGNQLTAYAIKAGRVVVITILYTRGGGILGFVVGIAKQPLDKASQAMGKVRGNIMKGRHEERMSGRGKVFGSEGLAQAYRRVGDAGDGGLSVTRGGRARYAAKKQERLSNMADEMLKKDGGRYSGDDSANALALQKGMTNQKFVNEYARELSQQRDKNGNRIYTDQQAAKTARETLAGIEQSYGAKMGTDAMRVAAFKARASSKTGYESGDYNAMGADAGSLMHDGLITQADAAAILKNNKERIDQNGVGFTEMFRAMGNAKEQYANGKRGTRDANGRVRAEDAIFDDAEIAKLQDDALIGAGPGAIIGGYHKGVTGVLPAMQRRVAQAVEARNAAAAAAGGAPTREQADALVAADEEVQRQMAAFRSRHQLSGQVSEKVQGILSKAGEQEIVFTDINGKAQKTSVREYSELLSNTAKAQAAGINNTAFLNAKYEYDTAGVEDYNRQQQMRTGGGPGALPNPTAGVGG